MFDGKTHYFNWAIFKSTLLVHQRYINHIQTLSIDYPYTNHISFIYLMTDLVMTAVILCEGHRDLVPQVKTSVVDDQASTLIYRAARKRLDS